MIEGLLVIMGLWMLSVDVIMMIKVIKAVEEGGVVLEVVAVAVTLALKLCGDGGGVVVLAGMIVIPVSYPVLPP